MNKQIIHTNTLVEVESVYLYYYGGEYNLSLTF